MTSTVADKMRLLRQDIRHLQREAGECRRKALEPFLAPEYVIRATSQAREAEELITRKEAECEDLRNSVQLDLFKTKP